MARKSRVQYEGAVYHLMSRSGRNGDIFLDDKDRHMFLATLAAACRKTGWQVHAYCLVKNHSHLVVETPQPNLVDGMRWFTPGKQRRKLDNAEAFQGVRRGWKGRDLEGRAKGDPEKIRTVRRLRQETTMTSARIAEHLAIGASGHAANRVRANK